MEFLIFGTLWFWIALVGFSGLIIWSLEEALSDVGNDSGGGLKATGLIVLGLVIYYIFGSKADLINLGQFIITHPGTIVLIILGYLVAGVVWSFVKWYFFLLGFSDKTHEKLDGEAHYGDKYKTLSESEFPTAKKNKFRIISWMTYWPFSLLWFAVNEPIKRAFNFIYARISSLYEKIEKKVLASVYEKNQLHAEKNKEAQAAKITSGSVNRKI